MIKISYSNRMEQLLELVIEEIAGRRSGSIESIFEPITIIIPNGQVGAYLRYGISRSQLGAAMNIEVKSLDGFVQGHLPAEMRFLRQHELKRVLLGIFSEAPAGLPDEVRRYLEVADLSDTARDRRRYQLADKFASLFSAYAASEVGIIETWGDGAEFSVTADLINSEVIQRALFQRIREETRDRQDASSPAWIWYERHLLNIDKGDFGELPKAIFVFGFSFLSRFQQNLLAKFGEWFDIYLYLNSPLLEFAEDAAKYFSNASDINRFGKHANAGGTLANLSERRDNSPAQFWTKLARKGLLDLAQISAKNVEWKPAYSLSNAPTASLLSRLQGDLVARRYSSPTRAAVADTSLQVLACPGIQREAEVIASEVWRLLQAGQPPDNNNNEGLRFNDIGIFVADRGNRTQYVAQLAAAFHDAHQIPINLVDIDELVQTDIEGVRILLELAYGEFTRSDLFELFDHPSFRARFPEANIDGWKKLCVNLPILGWEDRSAHADTFIQEDIYNWDQGLRRLTLGIFMEASDEPEAGLYLDAYLPERPATSKADVALFVTVMRSLIADRRFMTTQRLDFCNWGAFFAQMTQNYLESCQKKNPRPLETAIGCLRQLAEYNLDGRTFSGRTALDFALSLLPGPEKGYRHRLLNGVVVSPLASMRALPFKYIFICGLGENIFPRKDFVDELDLRQSIIDGAGPSNREADKQAFLEVISSARERLYLTFVSRDSLTGDDLQPSSIVQELYYVLRTGYINAEDISSLFLTRHSLRRYDSGYTFPSTPEQIPADGQLASLSLLGRAERLAVRLRDAMPPRPARGSRYEIEDFLGKSDALLSFLGIQGVSSVPSGESNGQRSFSISLSGLHKFLCCPLQGWAQYMVKLKSSDDDDDKGDDPMLEQTILEKTIVLRNVMSRFLASPATDDSIEEVLTAYRASQVFEQLKGRLPVGVFVEKISTENEDVLRNWHELYKANVPIGHPFKPCFFGSPERNISSVRLEPMVFSFPNTTTGTPEGATVEIKGNTQYVSEDQTTILSFVVGKGKEIKIKHHMRGFLDAICLAYNYGRQNPGTTATSLTYTSIVISESLCEEVEWDITSQEAESYLRNLIEDMISQRHDYLFPIETVAAWRPCRATTTFAEVLAEQQAEYSLYPKFSYEYGPVRVDESLMPAAEDGLANRLFERRFEQFFLGRQV